MVCRRSKFIASLALAVSAPTIAFGTPSVRKVYFEGQRYVIHYTPGKAWMKGKTVFEQKLRPHVDYLKRLRSRKILLLGGPFLDDSGGMAVIAVASPKEAKQILKSDPAIKSGLLKGTVHPWHVAIEQ